MHASFTHSSIVHRLKWHCGMKAGPFHASLLSTLLSLFSYLVFYLCYFSRRRSFWKNLLVGQKKCDEKLHINGLFCQLIVLTLQCCCVPCASRQANQWLLIVNPPHLPKRNCSFVYLCCVMSILNLNSLLSNILNYWRVLFLYIWCTFHWLKLWSLQSWGWNCGLQVEH